MLKDDVIEVQDEAIKDATMHIRTQKDRYKALRWLAVCLTFIVVTALVCGTVLAWHAITEQQYALNMQYAGLLDYVNSATITETGDNGIIVQCDSNTTEGGANRGENR